MQEVDVEKTKLETTAEFNPWDVSDASEFLRYCCPECDQKCAQLGDFSKHAIESHPKAQALFESMESKDIKEEEPEEVVVKSDHVIDDLNDIDWAPEAELRSDSEDMDFNDDDLEAFRPKSSKRCRHRSEDPNLNITYVQDQACFRCESCNISKFKTKSEVAKHLLYEQPHNLSQSSFEMCQWCIEVFKGNDSLNSHIREKHPTSDKPLVPYKCHLCQYVLKDMKRLRFHHEKKHIDSHECYPYFCAPCWKGFLFHEDLLAHNTTEHSEQPGESHQCSECSMVFHDMRVFSVHQTVHGLKTEAYVCHLCPEVCASELSLANHYILDHKGKVPSVLKCNFCDFTSSSISIITGHSIKDHDKPSLCYSCNQCDERFERSVEMNKHRKNAHVKSKKLLRKSRKSQDLKPAKDQDFKSSAGKTYICEICGFSTHKVEYLWTHNRYEHDLEKHLKCPHCERTFPTKFLFENHIDRFHREIGETKYVCDICGERFHYQTSVKAHQREKCLFKKPVRLDPLGEMNCPSCHQQVIVRGLYRHFKEDHANEDLPKNMNLDLVCKVCDDIFATDLELQNHLVKNHMPSLPTQMCESCNTPMAKGHNCFAFKKKNESMRFQCAMCNYSIGQKDRLQEHVKEVHEHDLPHKCDECDKRFASTRKLKQHFRYIHMKIPCDICNKMQVNAQIYRLHKFNVHKVKDGAKFCLYCPKSVFFTQSKLDLHMRKYHKNLLDKL